MKKQTKYFKMRQQLVSDSLNVKWIMPQIGQRHFKNLATTAAKK